MALPVLVINRDCDTDRWQAPLAACRAHGVEPERLLAVDAHAPGFKLSDHADLIGDHFWGGETIKPGAIGCFLSHRGAWQRVLDAGWDAALILEDDADLTEDLGRVSGLIDRNWDLLFVNDRLAAWAGAVMAETPVISLPDLVENVSRAGGPKRMGIKPAPGADAYVVSAKGAARLLSLTAAMQMVCGVDWAMIWLGLAANKNFESIGELEILRKTTSPPDDPIRVGVLRDPISRLRGGPSVLVHRIQRRIDEMLDD